MVHKWKESAPGAEWNCVYCNVVAQASNDGKECPIPPFRPAQAPFVPPAAGPPAAGKTAEAVVTPPVVVVAPVVTIDGVAVVLSRYTRQDGVESGWIFRRPGAAKDSFLPDLTAPKTGRQRKA